MSTTTSAGIGLRRLQHLVLWVSDVGRSVRFYTEVLGFEVKRQRWLDESGVEKGNLIARRGPDRGGGLALVGHSDCVPFDGAWEGARSGDG